jgi:hypothetical protein
MVSGAGFFSRAHHRRNLFDAVLRAADHIMLQPFTVIELGRNKNKGALAVVAHKCHYMLFCPPSEISAQGGIAVCGGVIGIAPNLVCGIVTNEPTKFRLGQNLWCFNKILTKIIITLTAQALGGTHV